MKWEFGMFKSDKANFLSWLTMKRRFEANFLMWVVKERVESKITPRCLKLGEEVMGPKAVVNCRIGGGRFWKRMIFVLLLKVALFFSPQSWTHSEISKMVSLNWARFFLSYSMHMVQSSAKAWHVIPLFSSIINRSSMKRFHRKGERTAPCGVDRVRLDRAKPVP